MKKIISIFILCYIGIGYGQSTIKTMFYNVLNYPTAPPDTREKVLETIIDSYEPDIFMICELETEAGGEEILNESLNDGHSDYSSAPFLFNFSNSDIELHQLLYFNNKKFTLIQSQRLINAIRDINWYTLELITDEQNTDPIRIEIFVAHLKASQGADNEQKRLDMVEVFVDNQINLDQDAYVLFAGDFNLYSSNEPAYQAILNSGNRIVMVDPINTDGDWHTNSTFEGIHTQSTRISSSGFDNFGSGGGLDDRFDFIMMSENMRSDTKLSYIPNTYASYGNNGNCYNQRIDDSNCTGIYDAALRSALYNMSDHLPVVMELQTNQEFLSTPDFNQITKLVQLNSGTIVDDILSLTINNSLGSVNFKIYNTLGQEVQSFTSKNQSILNVSVESLSGGVYYIIPTNIKHSTIKFVKRG
ncbi:hypothetical protein [Aquimarina sp. 2201CG5-10]|uniref:hypothetical protein n=1 Tax=Aquimarina callyspongiae TaxID=3098150 RepID=UPI002AB443B8|nr:hypothetical protein [Aquimarina sp. 2201CG5-10]MDY8135682.1 hypothetical protein [Aquimarina sp. 2201CG5-10]